MMSKLLLHKGLSKSLRKLHKKKMQIFIRALGGKTLPLNIYISDTVLSLKEVIRDREGILLSGLTLIFAGK